MTSKKVIQTRGRKKYLAAAIPLILATQANAVEFNFGDVEMSLDSQLTLGSSWRMEDQSASLIQGIEGSATNAENNNDGDLNFEKGDAFSQVFKGTHDFQISYENFGAFIRGKYWYDALLEDGEAADGSKFSDENGSDYAKFSGAQILDAFVYGEFELGEMPLDLRLGKQVLSWGESTFIQGGINQTNPFDVSALRRPGAELKEGLIPVNMAFASLGVTENLSAEAFYQIGHQETVIPHCGTYFGTNDYAPEGCGPVETAAGNVSRDSAFGADGIKSPNGDDQFGVAFRYFSESLDTEFGLFAMQIDSRVPLVSGRKSVLDEVGVVLGVDLTGGNGSNFSGLYAAFKEGVAAKDEDLVAGMAAASLASWAIVEDAASTSPTGTYSALQIATAQGLYAAGSAAVAGGALAGMITDQGAAASSGLITPMTYFVEYPEDQQLAGISFATNIAGVAVSGELTHKLDVPFQINATQLLATGLQTDATYALNYAGAFQQGLIDNSIADPTNPANAAAVAAIMAGADAFARGEVATALGSYGIEALDLADGEALSGFKMFDVTQFQVTAIKLFDQVLGANRYALVAEAGVTYVHDFDEDGDLKFDGNGDGLDTVTEVSSGYRLRLSGDYSDVFAGVNLSPVLSFAHDVDGVAPAPGGNFLEDRKTIGLALNAEYANMYTAGISYTMYGGSLTNNLDDRDYAAVTLGVQF